MTGVLLTKKDVEQLSREDKRNFYLYNPQCYVKARNEDKLYSMCLEIITKAILYKGLNKTEKEIEVITIMFCDEIKRKYAYVSIWKIAEVLQEYKYGEGFNVSVKGLIDILDTQLYEINKANKKRAIELEREAKTPLLADTRTEEEKQMAFIQKAYDSFLKYGYFIDLNNGIFQFVRENGLYDWTDEEKKQAEIIAISKANEIEETRLSRAKRTFSMDDIKTISNLLENGIRKSDSFDNINKTELVKQYFKNMKEQGVEKLNLKTE